MSHASPSVFSSEIIWRGYSWDKERGKYKITESAQASGDSDNYAEYAFVVRERLGT